jgi:tetratricopeptide (TPR) repeat protein
MSRFGNLEFGRQSREQTPSAEVVTDEVLHLREADAAFRRGAFEQALRSYARALEFDPNNTTAWVGQVRMLIELGQFKEANLWVDKALERFPRHAEALAAKAVALARQGDTRAALAFSDAAIEEESASPYVWLARGDVLLARTEKRAEYCFTKALAVASRDWLWPWLASRIHAFYRKFSLAMKLVSQALALDSSQAVLWLQLGRCQSALGLAGAANDSLTQARELDPQCPEVSEAAAELREAGFWGRLAGRWRGWWEG